MGLDQSRAGCRGATFSFLSSFRELVRGRPAPGEKCVIMYDPARIVPAIDYDASADYQDPGTRMVSFRCPPSSTPVTAHVQFRAGGPLLEIPLSTRSGPLEQAPIRRDGRGMMLFGEFTVADDAEWIMMWFTHIDYQNCVRYDSRFGENFLFRFIDVDFDIVEESVEVVSRRGHDVFHCDVTTVGCVRSPEVRYRVVNYDPSSPSTVVPLRALEETAYQKGNRKRWTTGDIAVPPRAVVAFDFVYYVDGVRYKEDNQGQFFVVTGSEHLEALSASANDLGRNVIAAN